MIKIKGCVLRNKTYHARSAIPEDVRAHFGCREFTRTLNTADPYKAEKLASGLIVQWKELIQSARLSPRSVAPPVETRQDSIERLRNMWRDVLKNDDPVTSEAMEFVVTDEMERHNLSLQEQRIVRGETILFSSQIEPYTSQLIEEGQAPKTVGVNSYRKAKQKLIEKNLIKDCPNKLPRLWSLLRVNPGIAIKGNPGPSLPDLIVKWNKH